VAVDDLRDQGLARRVEILPKKKSEQDRSGNRQAGEKPGAKIAPYRKGRRWFSASQRGGQFLPQSSRRGERRSADRFFQRHQIFIG
jgi:hypothetical protein